MKKNCTFIIVCVTLLTTLALTSGKNRYGKAKTTDPTARIPAGTVPLMDYWMRDTWMTLAPDGYYYLTGTTADPTRQFPGRTHCWDWNDGIYVFRSRDMKSWESLGRVWSLDDDATWQREPKVFDENEKFPRRSLNGDVMDNRFRAVWAPEIHYLKSKHCWYIVACMNNSKTGGKGSFILKSLTGKPEGPYANIAGNNEGPIFNDIDGSLFEDTDGKVYFIGHNHYIALMKDDMTGFAEPIRKLQETCYDPEPYIEGAFICKEGGRYHLVQAIWSHRLPDGTDTYCPIRDNDKTRYSYDCIIASADNIYGPYSPRYNAITGGGHNNLFRDKQGKWWATIFFNPRGAQAKEYAQTCRPGLVPMKYQKGRFRIDSKRNKTMNINDK